MASAFLTTRWSLVLTAGHGDAEGQRALAELCELYWPPVYAFLCRKCGDSEQAKDLTQGFFLDLLAREDVAAADPDRGRFRSFLLKCAQNFAAKDHARDHAQKRGGGKLPVSLDALRAVDGDEFPIADHETPTAIFDRRWATALVEQVMRRLATEYAERSRTDVFEGLKGYLEEIGETLPYAEVGERLEMTTAAIKVNVHRLRQRFRELLLSEVTHTLGEGQDPMDEIRTLQAALQRHV